MTSGENHHGKYRYGKQEHPISFKDFQERMERAHLDLEEESYLWLLYYTGCRKSEGYERLASDVEITPELFIIDFHQRKKHGALVDPLEIPRAWPGIELLVKITERALARKPLTKTVFYYEQKERRSRIQKEQWLFPNIQSSKAWLLIKRVLGQEFYPHFLRLNRLTEIGSDPEASLIRLKSFSGIKSVSSLEHYLGVSKAEQKGALDWMEKQMNKD
jgi:hypothetical protein